MVAALCTKRNADVVPAGIDAVPVLMRQVDARGNLDTAAFP